MRASSGGNLVVIGSLLVAGGSIDCLDSDGYTPLMMLLHCTLYGKMIVLAC